MATGVQVVIDCADPARLAEFWATALGYQMQDPPPGFASWPEFLTAYNEFCAAHGGIPLFNQTDGITPAQVQEAFGDRLKTFAEVRRSYDPGERLLNPYFRDILAGL